ncbi:hypothetical protein [Xanthomonas sp. NCPPB 2632]|jgi:hypothetical protein|uniref:hypothetical protein n=1 Tax=Xanthomonas sp. NCPPB 2632 TaxID=3240912 RepID=UPI0035133428
MHCVKLTVLIEDSADLDMEVRVVAPDTPAPMARATAAAPISLVRTAAVPSPPPRRDEDDYALGGYAGI